MAAEAADPGLDIETLTPSENAAYAVANDWWLAQRRTAEWDAGRRLWKILMLSTSLEVFDALCRNEPVPVNRLDPAWTRRFGLRQSEAV